MRLPTLSCFLLSSYGLAPALVAGIPVESPHPDDVVPLHLAVRGRLDRDAGAVAEPAVRRRHQELRVRHAGLPDPAAPAALQGCSPDTGTADCADDAEGSSNVARSDPKARRTEGGAGAAPLPALALRREDALSPREAELEKNVQTPALDAREAAANAQNAPATTTAVAPTATGTNTPLPTTYTPGWCGLHIRQVLWNTCLHFNHKDCVRVNHTISLYDAKQTLLARYAPIPLTFDGKATVLLTSALPNPVNVTQLGVITGDDLTPGSATIGNFWPVQMGYKGEVGGNGTWRNDERPRCRSGAWQHYLENRDFDCGFSCPPSGGSEAPGGAGGQAAQKAVEL